MAGEYMSEEIRQQPKVLERILREGTPQIAEVAQAIQERRPRFGIFVARGTSDHAAIYARYLVETRLGLPCGLASPSITTVYQAAYDLHDVLVVGVSQSGGSPDLVEPLARAREQGAVTLAVTNNLSSPLAEAAEYQVDVLAGPERAVVATKTYTAELLSLYLLVDALAGGSGEETRYLPERAADLLEMDPEIGALATRYRFAEQLVVTARGYAYTTALETALKLMESSYLVAHAFSGADLLHGPMAMVDRGFPVIAIALAGPGGTALCPVLERLRELEADSLVVGDPSFVALGTVGLPLPNLGPERLAPILAIIPMQLFAFHLAVDRGSDPDRPRRLKKVTETR